MPLGRLRGKIQSNCLGLWGLASGWSVQTGGHWLLSLGGIGGGWPFPRGQAIWLDEEEGTGGGEDLGGDDPGGVGGVAKEFMVQLAGVVGDAQMDEGAAAIVAAPNTLFIVVHWWGLLEVRNS